MWRRSEIWGLLAVLSFCVLPVLYFVGWTRTPFMNSTAADQCNEIERDGGKGLTTPADGPLSHPFSTPCPGSPGDNAVPWFINPGIWLFATLAVVGAVLWVLLALREWLRDPERTSLTGRSRTTADREGASASVGSGTAGPPVADSADDGLGRSRGWADGTSPP